MILVFDLDGTLGEFKIDWRKMGEEMENYFYITMNKNNPFWIEKLATLLVKKGHKKKVDNFFRKYERDSIFEVYPYTKKILSLPYKKAILSNNSYSTIKRVINENNWKIDYFLGRDKLKKPKPWPEGLLKIKKHFNDKILFIGNSNADEIAAKNAKVPFLKVKPRKNFYKSLTTILNKF